MESSSPSELTGPPSFDRVSRRMLFGEKRIAVALVRFDVLEEGLPTWHQPYSERREILELLDFGPGCHVCPRFEDGEALWESVCERGNVEKSASCDSPSERCLSLQPAMPAHRRPLELPRVRLGKQSEIGARVLE